MSKFDNSCYGTIYWHDLWNDDGTVYVEIYKDVDWDVEEREPYDVHEFQPEEIPYTVREAVERFWRKLVFYDDLSTTAKITCMNEFIDKMIPYDWDDVNEGDVADLEATIREWISDQYYIDEDGYWYDEGRKI